MNILHLALAFLWLSATQGSPESYLGFRTALPAFADEAELDDPDLAPGLSVVGNYTLTNVNTHRSSGIRDEILSLEVVLADGGVVRTGTRAFAETYPGTGWFAPSNAHPDLRALFLDAYGTLGIITKAAVRIYPKNEAQAMPLAAFSDYATAIGLTASCRMKRSIWRPWRMPLLAVQRVLTSLLPAIMAAGRIASSRSSPNLHSEHGTLHMSAAATW